MSTIKRNPHLAISIPTYNRASFLEASLKEHIPILEKYGIPIYIFDNHSTDSTELLIRKYQEIYPLIEYFQHQSNIGAVKNVSYALLNTSEDFVWLLGDTYKISESAIKFVLNNLDHIDIFLFNLAGNRRATESQIYENRNLVLSELSGVASCLSSAVIKRKMLLSIHHKRFSGSYYPHTCYLFEIIAFNPFKLYWVQHISITIFKQKNLEKKNWSSSEKALEMGVEAWADFVFSLPQSYSIDAKVAAAKQFGIVSKLLSLKGILWMRAHNGLNFKQVKIYKHSIKLCISNSLKLYFIYAVCLVPRFVWGFLLKCYLKLPRHFHIESILHEK